MALRSDQSVTGTSRTVIERPQRTVTTSHKNGRVINGLHMSYAKHTIWSDPGPFHAQLIELPNEPRPLADAIENFLIHHAIARAMGFGVPDYAEADRNLRSAERLLGTAIGRDARSLFELRNLPDYLYGTCHDFALIAVSRFRSLGVEARLRVGFADYFGKGRWEDHWLCEYRSGEDWRLLDAQLGRRARVGYGIEFEIEDVPRKQFRPACEMWMAIRARDIDPAICGVSHAGISGDWFAAGSVLRDAATLSAIETLPWDYWGPAREIGQTMAVPTVAYSQIDELANAFLQAPNSPETASTRLDQLPWARPGETVLSFIDGGLRERPLI